MSKRPEDPFEMVLQVFQDIEEARLRPLPPTQESSVPGELIKSKRGMSNYDHSIDPGMEEDLRSEEFWSPHAAWDFFGKVWFRDGLFHEEVWAYGSPKEVLSAPSLKELMGLVNDKYGRD